MDDRQLAKQGEERFSSAILPRYLKRVASVDSLIPELYLKGVSTGSFSEALKAILGEGAPGLSANSVVRLKAVWEQEYQEWTRRDLSGKRYVYLWADGLHVNVRLDEKRSCILVIMAADEHGNKELVAVSDGYRESTASWREKATGSGVDGARDLPLIQNTSQYPCRGQDKVQPPAAAHSFS